MPDSIESQGILNAVQLALRIGYLCILDNGGDSDEAARHDQPNDDEHDGHFDQGKTLRYGPLKSHTKPPRAFWPAIPGPLHKAAQPKVPD